MTSSASPADPPQTAGRYHLGELKIALDSSHPAHIVPLVGPPSNRVLDVGCGAGQTLIATCSDRFSIGLDVDHEALKLGRSIANNIGFVCGRAEALPLKDSQFDLVIARVSLPYTNIGASLKEFRRVLVPGGRVWLTLHDLHFLWHQTRSRSAKSWTLFFYVLVNSVIFSLTQQQIRLPGRRYYESFQTGRGMTRALAKAGFEDIVVDHHKHFLVTAVASNSAPR